MILHHPFYSAVALMSPLVEREDIPTAATDGDKIYYNAEFLGSLKPKDVVFVLAHEVEHIVRQHCIRVGERDRFKWNVAADHGINLDLMAAGLEGPKGDDGKFMGLADRQYEGMSAERVYRMLPEQDKQDGQGGDGDPSNGDGDGDPSNGDGDDSGQGQGNNIFDGDVLPATNEEGKSLTPTEVESKAREVRGRILQASAQVQASKGIGAIPQHLRGMIAELTEPVVDWKHELREFVTARCEDDFDWSRLNRRVRHRGLRLPSMYSEAVGGIAIILDTSGSCWSEIGPFLSEVLAVASDAKPESIDVLFVDTRVQEHVSTTADDFEADMGDLLNRPPHGGGTDLRVGFSFIEQHVSEAVAVICLTDMMTPWPSSFALADQTLFVDTFGHEDAPFGRKVAYNK